MAVSMPAPSSKTSQPSYADRAKQATNQTTSLPANAILAPAYPSSHLPESSSSARNLGIEAYPPLAATSPKFDRKAREQSQSSSPLSMNASVGHPNDSGSSIPETHSGQTSSNKPPPPANVWHIRKDQISPARGKNLQTKSQSRPIGTTSKQTSLPDVGIGSSHSTNGVLLSHSSENVPPFTLRSQAPAFLPGEDKESWPEVSSSSRPAASVSGRGSKDGSEKAERDGARKGEKPKWVQIPASELQATADALQAQSHHRNRSKYAHSRTQTPSTGNSPLDSVVVSRRSSRAPSIHRQSRAHSQTRSVNTSPLLVPRLYLPAEGEELDTRQSRSGSRQEPRENRQIPGVNGYASGIAGHPVTSPPNHSVGFAYTNPANARSSELNRNEQLEFSSNRRASAEALCLPPIAVTSRPPPPSESEAFGGYRDVTAMLKQTGQHVVFGNLSQNTTLTLPNVHLTERTHIVDETAESKKPSLTFAVGIVSDAMYALHSKSHPRAKYDRSGKTKPLTLPARYVSIDLDAVDFNEYPLEFGTTRHSDAGNSGIPSDSDRRPYINPTSLSVSASMLGRRESGGSDTFEVRDFGYGFGPMSGSGSAPAVVREDMLARERHRELERQWRRDNQLDPETLHEVDVQAESYDIDKGPDFARRDWGSLQSSQDRPYFSQRGRSNGQGFRRGFGSRNFSRGGYQGQFRPQHNLASAPHSHFQPSPPQVYSPEPLTTAYYIPPPEFPPYGVAYDVPYSQYPPMPVAPLGPAPGPISIVPFPLDHTRYYLLGQLEYYLSPQNMAQDFYLRQQMNPEGWISIPLLASFNRVRQLTVDVQLVYEVLNYSQTVEVIGDWVRMIGEQWKPFVLPVTIPSSEQEQEEPPVQVEEESTPVDEDEEEEVVFVMG